jgi:hypothetical protein
MKKSMAGGSLCTWLKDNMDWIEKFKLTQNKPENPVVNPPEMKLPQSPSKARVGTATGARTS